MKYKNLDSFIQDIESGEFLNVKDYEVAFKQFKNELEREEFNFHNWKGLFLTHKDLDKVENFWALATADIVNATDEYDFVCIRRKGEISFSRNLKQTKLHIGDLVKAIGREIYKTTNAGGRDVVGGITI